jgi:hypothetical protein
MSFVQNDNEYFEIDENVKHEYQQDVEEFFETMRKKMMMYLY